MSTSNLIPETDPFFEVIADGQWNACIGIQGSDQDYVDGYLEAALELVAAVLDRELYSSRDTLAMPILYNARHALELSLKSAINRLHMVGAIANRHIPNHDILSHWTHLRNAEVGDSILRQTILDLELYVVSLAKIDDDGQEFRYSTNRDGQKSLGNLAVVNLQHIRKNLEVMSSVLARLKNRLMDFENERRTGSHTRDCSRADLKAIALALGDHATWKDNSFNQKKADIRAQFGLSSGKFSDAVVKIRESRPLAALVGLENSLRYLSDAKAVFALQQWADAHLEIARNSEKRDLVVLSNVCHEEYSRVTRELTQEIADKLSDEEFADIEVMFYIGLGWDFSECYDEMLEGVLKKYRNAATRHENLYHIMTKPNLLESVVVGARAVGRPFLATILRAIRPVSPDIPEHGIVA